MEKERFLEEALGPEIKYGKGIVWIPTTLYTIISVVGTPGNILTTLTIYKISYMKTPPNYFIFNLAIADLMTLVLGKYSSLSVYI